VSADKKIQAVAGKFIDRGIEKYKGVVDNTLLSHLKRSDCNFVPYKFEDGRYLLVQPDINCGFLYPDLDTVYAKLVLE
jgi:hypothetical protein